MLFARKKAKRAKSTIITILNLSCLICGKTMTHISPTTMNNIKKKEKSFANNNEKRENGKNVFTLVPDHAQDHLQGLDPDQDPLTIQTIHVRHHLKVKTRIICSFFN
jgi:hypothetical protein